MVDNLDESDVVELFQFNRKSASWYFSASKVPLQYLGVTYEPADIKRGKISNSTERAKSTLDLTFPLEHPFAYPYVTTSQFPPTSCTVLRGSLSQGFETIWKGRIGSSKVDGPRLKLTSDSIFKAMQRTSLRAKEEKTCHHFLYHRGCFVDKELHKTTDSVFNIENGITLTFTGAVTALPDGSLTNGYIENAEGETRLIISHAAGVVTVKTPFNEIGAGSVVDLYAGCDHLFTTCTDVFSNGDNFGGNPFKPEKKNPATGSIV